MKRIRKYKKVYSFWGETLDHFKFMHWPGCVWQWLCSVKIYVYMHVCICVYVCIYVCMWVSAVCSEKDRWTKNEQNLKKRKLFWLFKETIMPTLLNSNSTQIPHGQITSNITCNEDETFHRHHHQIHQIHSSDPRDHLCRHFVVSVVVLLKLLRSCYAHI